ncbi:MAG TPA: beta/gamma crystallin-related protein [Usitatibacter sp.]|nr:beta/gamma crystallin-related protein [Usitatibacter sp.]
MSLRPLSLILAALGLAVSSAHAARIQIYQQPNFTGSEITLSGETPDLGGIGFAGQGASLVLSERWEVCSEANYRGQCTVLGPGRYARVNQNIQSIRPLGAAIAEAQREQMQSEWVQREQRREAIEQRQERREDRREDRHDRTPPPPARYAARAGAIDLFPGPDFRGRPIRVERDVSSLARQDDQVSSVIVHEGVWELCTEPGFRGRCRAFEPGRYESLGRRLDDRISSVRRVR